MIINIEAPILGQFLGCYIHQDFNFEFGSLEKAVAAYFNDASKEELITLSLEMKQLLSQPVTDADFDAWLQNEGSYYYTYADGMTGRQWIEKLYKTVLAKAGS